MNVDLLQKAGDQTSWRKVEITGRYVTVISAPYGIEISAKGWGSFEVDDADEIDFGVQFEGGGEIFVRNISDQQNDCVIASAPFYVRRKKSVELTADLSNINISSGTVGFDVQNNNVKVTNKVELEETQVLKVKQQGYINIDPLQVLKVKQQGYINIDPLQVLKTESVPKYTLSYVTHQLTAGDVVAGGWTYNNGNNERLIISATANVELGHTDFAEGEKLPLNDLAPNQDFVFVGLEGDEIDIIEMVRV